MSPFDVLLLRIAAGEKHRKSAKWDWQFGVGILLAFSVIVVFWRDFSFIEDESSTIQLWLKVFLCGLASVAFAYVCGRFVPALVTGAAFVAIWVYFFI